jgi:hypothetical protein
MNEPRCAYPDCGEIEQHWHHLQDEVKRNDRTNHDFVSPSEPEVGPKDPSPTPHDHSTWGFYCDACKKFFDLVRDGKVVTHEGNTCTRYHSCGAEARYIGYAAEAVAPEPKPKIGDNRRSAPHLGPCGICGADSICQHDMAFALGRRTEPSHSVAPEPKPDKALNTSHKIFTYIQDCIFSSRPYSIKEVAEIIRGDWEP